MTHYKNRDALFNAPFSLTQLNDPAVQKSKSI